ncbi:hypothetical protein ABIB08_004737 [Bradyrhizobium sp. RT11b]
MTLPPPESPRFFDNYRKAQIMWTTRLDWNGTHWLVYLSRDGAVVATMTLDEWAKLSATEYLLDDRKRQAS